MTKFTTAFFLAILVVVLLALGPWLTIWALNELGQYLWPGKVVPFNFWTWAATIILYSFFTKSPSYDKK